MSGIAGIRADTRPDPGTLRAAIFRLRHRGGAREIVHTEGAVALAVTQSAREAGREAQPLRSADGRFTLVADGYLAGTGALRAEPSGVRPETAGGWAPLLDAWAHWTAQPPEDFPRRMLQRLEGAFAFALHDRDTGRLVLARDRSGARPLYFARTMFGWAFASEPKALLAITGAPAIDPAALAAWLQGGFVAGRRTLMAGIERVLPGEIVVLERDADPARLPPPPPRLAEPRPGAEDAAQRLDAALRETLEDPALEAGPGATLLLTRDIGSAFLLGALARAGRLPARTVSVGQAGEAADGGAAALARHFGVEHETVPVGRAELTGRLALAAWVNDDAGGEVDAPALLALGESLGADTGPVITAAGAAESFAATPRFRMRRLTRWIEGMLEPGTGGYRTRGAFRGLERSLFSPALQRAAAEWREPLIDAWRAMPPGWSDLQRMQHLDLATWLPAVVLPGFDRALAATGHGWRAPWLAPRLTGLGLALPDHVKRGGRGVAPFFEQHAQDRWLPRMAWTAPHPPALGPWMNGATLARVETTLPSSPAIRAWFAPDAVPSLVRMRREGRPVARRLLALVRFALWHRIYIEGDGERPPVCDPLDFLEGRV